MAGFYDPRHRDRSNMTDHNSEEKEECKNGEDTQQCVQLVEKFSLAEESELPALDDDEEEEEDDDDEGWITPENFQQVCEEMGGVMEELPQSLAVGCITTDFAMQV